MNTYKTIYLKTSLFLLILMSSIQTYGQEKKNYSPALEVDIFYSLGKKNLFMFINGQTFNHDDSELEDLTFQLIGYNRKIAKNHYLGIDFGHFYLYDENFQDHRYRLSGKYFHRFYIDKTRIQNKITFQDYFEATNKYKSRFHFSNKIKIPISKKSGLYLLFDQRIFYFIGGKKTENGFTRYTFRPIIQKDFKLSKYTKISLMPSVMIQNEFDTHNDNDFIQYRFGIAFSFK